MKICPFTLYVMLVVAVLCLLGIATPPATAATAYYLSSTSGNDTSDGTSPQSAWEHLSKVYLKSISPMPFQPGDQILLKRGDQWEEEIRLCANGTSDAPITIGAYGHGPKPVLLGEAQKTNWEPVFDHGGIYTTDLGTASILGAIVQDGKSMRAIYPTGSVRRGEDMELFFSELQSGVLAGQFDGRVWLRMASTEKPEGRVRVFRHAGVSLSNSAHVQVENLDIEHFVSGIDVENSRNIMIKHNDIQWTLGIGIYLRLKDTDCLVESNTVWHAGNTALYVLKGARNIFRDNWVSHVDNSVLGITTSGDHMGIGLQESQQTLVEYNYFTRSGGIDFYFERGSTVRFNYLSRVTSAGAPHGTNLELYGNIYNLGNSNGQPISKGINAVATGPGAITVFNNTIFNASGFFLMGSADKGGQVVFSKNIAFSTLAGNTLTAFGPNVVSNHNCFFTPGAPVFSYSRASFYTLATYRQTSSLEKDSILANPQFVSSTPVAPLDFRIPSTSGCNSLAKNTLTATQEHTYDHDRSKTEKSAIGAFEVDAVSAWPGNARQLCRAHCFGRPFHVAKGVYLVNIRFSPVALSKTSELTFGLNGTRIIADPELSQLGSDDDMTRHFLVRPEKDLILLQSDGNLDDDVLAEVEIVPFDISHGEGQQIIPW
jgi:hypothetical protein